MRIKTYAEAKAIKQPGFYRAGDTLYLRVGNNGSKSWIQRLTIDNERHDIGLGSFKLVTLAEARDMAFENRKEARILADGGSGLVFPSSMRPGKPMSNMTLTKVLRDNGLADRTTVHGFRSSFRDWCADTGRPREIAEAALSHVVPGVEGAYFRSDLFERRRLLMEQWAAYLTSADSNVMSLHHG